MPKRKGYIAQKIYNIDNINLADRLARRGKKSKWGVIKHDRHRDEDNQNLSKSLRTDTFKVSKYTEETIKEWSGKTLKERTLKKLPYYPDRIAQWAMMNYLVPIWDKIFISHTYACILNRGIHKCAKDLQREIRKYKQETTYCLKLDIKKCYDSIDHNTLYKLLQEKLKDPLVLSWLNKVIQSTKGIPIGSYTSQYFANVYLAYFDHFCKETLKMKFYYRYADDIVILAKDKDTLRNWLRSIQQYINKDLLLNIKGNYQIFPVDKRGIDFVGYRFYHTHTLLRSSIKRRIIKLTNKYAAGKISNKAFKKRIAAYLGWMKYCDSKSLLSWIENKTGLHYSNWLGEKTTFSAIKNKSIRLVDIERHNKYFRICFVYHNKSYYIESENCILYDYLINKLNKDIILWNQRN